MSDENASPQLGQKRSGDNSGLSRPPRKKAGPSDPWKLKGHHIGRSIHAFGNFAQLILVGIQLDKDLALLPEGGVEKFPFETRLSYNIYTQLLWFLPDLKEGLSKGTIGSKELNAIGASIQAGANASRGDDVKTLKVAILEWIADPVQGLVPPIPHSGMTQRGFRHEVTGRELCPASLDWNDPSIKSALQEGTMIVQSDPWPIFLYLGGVYDPECPWDGFLRGHLLVKAFKHVFTSPSSVENEGRSTKSSNAANHGMSKVTVASIVYITTLVRFCLDSRSTFCWNDTMTDCENFYNVLLAFLIHPDETENVNSLLTWWNKQAFPRAVALYRAPTTNSALAKLLELRKKRAVLQALGSNPGN